jgi:CDP-paratose 2-epimerase
LKIYFSNLWYPTPVSIIIISGSSGLIGNETVRYFCGKGFDVIGIDNNFRFKFFGNDGDTSKVRKELESRFTNYKHFDADIRDIDSLKKIFMYYGESIKLVIHAAAQPSHDWAAKDPILDFQVNSLGTLNMLENTRQFCHEAVFIFMSTNKVYGDKSNNLTYTELETRYIPDDIYDYKNLGISEEFPIDQSLHSLFGVNKLSADLLTQEYGRYFGMKTTCLRGGCLSGPTHQGAELHGFLSYLVKCAVTKKHYSIFGYKGKQVRDNLHSKDVASAFWEIFLDPGSGEVFNLGGGKYSNISILEAINYLKNKGHELDFDIKDSPRIGDHKWWISDLSKFQAKYPDWKVSRDSFQIIDETIEALIS